MKLTQSIHKSTFRLLIMYIFIQQVSTWFLEIILSSVMLVAMNVCPLLRLVITTHVY